MEDEDKSLEQKITGVLFFKEGTWVSTCWKKLEFETFGELVWSTFKLQEKIRSDSPAFVHMSYIQQELPPHTGALQ